MGGRHICYFAATYVGGRCSPRVLVFSDSLAYNKYCVRTKKHDRRE